MANMVNMTDISEFDEVKRWIASIPKESTRRNYLYSLRAFVAFVGKNPKELIDEAEQDQKLDMRNRKDIVKSQCRAFYNYLVKDADVRDPHGKVVKKGHSSEMARVQTNAVRAFYSTFGFSFKFAMRERLPKSKVSERRELTSTEVKRIVDNTLNLRDKSIFTVIFQSGLRVSGICNLKYGDVREGIEKDESPLTLKLHDQKSGNNFITFVGRDGIESIKSYLSDLRRKGVELTDSDPLYVKDAIFDKTGKRREIQPILKSMIEQNLKSAVIRAGIGGKVDPHALRESFSKILIAHSVPKPVVDQFLAHSAGVLDSAYMSLTLDAMKELYVKNEGFISLNGAYIKTTVEELKEKLSRSENLISQMQIESSAQRVSMDNLSKQVLELTTLNARQQSGIRATMKEMQDIIDQLVAEVKKSSKKKQEK